MPNILPRSCRLAAAAAAALLLPAVARAQGVAAITEYSGEVAVEEASGNRRALAPVTGTARVANGTIAPGDAIVTAPGGAAAVRFADGGTVRAGAATRVAVLESAHAADPSAPRIVRRTVRLDAGRLRFDLPARDGVLQEIATPAGRLAVHGAQGSVAWVDGRLRVAVEGGRATLESPATGLKVPLGVGQAVELRTDDGPLAIRCEADGSRPVRVSIGVVRVDLTAGNALRIVPRPDGAALVTVLAGPVVVTRGETAPPRTFGTGEAFAAEAAGIEMPEIKPLPKPEPRPAPRRAAAAAAEAAEPPVPPLPEVPLIRGTVEASPMD